MNRLLALSHYIGRGFAVMTAVMLFSSCIVLAADPADAEIDTASATVEEPDSQPNSESNAEIPLDENREMEEVIVIGSRLRRRDYSSPSPIVTVDRKAFDFTGQGTLETAFAQMPQFTPSFDRTANFPDDGRAYLNLRGLGPHRTLVMLNGRRLGPSGVGSSVDVNNLPQALIESAEIITGGVSTVYGSDAIAGLVNFTIRRDFEGFGIDIGAYMTEQGDSNIYDISMAWGHNFASGRWQYHAIWRLLRP